MAHETQRSRLLHSPWQAMEILDAFPELKTAMDLSHLSFWKRPVEY